MTTWRVLVTLHNLVNIPPAACEEVPSHVFSVEARLVNHGGSGAVPRENPVSTFSSSEVTEATPHVFEIRLDEPRRVHGTAGCSCVWRCTQDVVGAVVEVTENGELVGSSTTFHIDVRKVVETAKLTTRIIGTEMGQVGISFTVDPADRVGYKERLERFLKRHNPRGLHLVQNVVDVVPEIDTFTKLYRKYGIRDYDKRLREFFATYGPEYMHDIPSLVKQWENREEELMRNLILDNGPELCDVDVNQRLTAFLTQYKLDRSNPSVAALVAEHSEDTNALMAALANRYGSEPDPRNYLFPATHYPPTSRTDDQSRYRARAAVSQSSTSPLRPQLAPARGSLSSALKGSPPRRAPHLRTQSTAGGVGASPNPQRKSGLNDSGSPAYLSLLGATPSSPFAVRRGKNLLAADKDASPRRGAAADPTNSQSGLRDGGFYSDTVFVDDATRGDSGRAAAFQPTQHFPVDTHGVTGCAEEDSPSHSSKLWLRMITMLRTSGRKNALEPGFFYYCSEKTFAELVDALDAFSRREREELAAEWAQLCREAVSVEPLDEINAAFDGALADVVHVAGLQPVQLRVASIAAIRHREHYKLFNACLATAKEPRTESFVLLGDERSLHAVARHGVDTLAKGNDSGALEFSASVRGGVVTSAPGRAPAMVFAKHPFSRWKQPRLTWLLVCDVVVGRCHETTPPARLPHNGTRAFLNEFDSSAFLDSASGPSVAVYDSRQVLPRLLVQCAVDPMLAACPAHPGRPVEYYVVAENAVACSRCVVVGAYKGLDVLPIEEAATQARDRLVERRRAADALAESMAARRKQLESEEEMIPTAPRRLRAQREIERLRREVEERVADILAAVERQDREQAEKIQTERAEAEAIRAAAVALSAELGDSLATAGPLAVVQALQRARREGMLESLVVRAQERIPELAVEDINPLNDVKCIAVTPENIGGATTTTTKNVSSSSADVGVLASGASRQDRRRHGHNVSNVGGDVRVPTDAMPPKLPPPQLCSQSECFLSSSDDLYSRYQSMSPTIEARETMHSRRPPAPHQQQFGNEDSAARNQREVTTEAAALSQSQSAASLAPRPVATLGHSNQSLSGVGHPSQGAAQPTKAKKPIFEVGCRGAGSAKDSLTKGWALLHQGDDAGAAAEWHRVASTCGDSDAAGAKARAYLAEAIEKNYEEAARWYRRCLDIDPADRLTAYNYGVLLEALLRRPHDAIAMYDRAAALGDHVAAARAQQLRAASSTMHSLA